MILTKLIEVKEGEPGEKFLGYVMFDVPPGPGHASFQGELVQIVGSRWAIPDPVEDCEIAQQCQLVVGIARASPIAKPPSPGLVDPTGRRLS